MKSITSLALVTAGVLFYVIAHAQTVSLPQLLPASPEPSLFVKAGVGTANLSTGAATATIPLYTIKIKDFSFPISLSYSTQGLKADEPSSRVGYGWVLNANGAITRTVKGAPDELASGMLKPPSDFPNGYSDSLFNYYRQSAAAGTGGTYDYGKDSQPDEYQFHVNGYSGKFVFDRSGVARMTSATNIAVTTGGGLIILTTPDGVVYRFGNANEITTSVPFANFQGYKVIKTAFFLDRIDLPTGEYINFNYTPINYTVFTGYTQTLQVLLSEDVLGGVYGCSYTVPPYSSVPGNVVYSSNYLSSITTSTGLTINLSNSDRADAGGDVKLDGLTIVGVKSWVFEYFVAGSNSSVTTGRFFLTKVRDVTMGTSAGQSLDYVLSYNSKESVPMPGYCGQDYLGFCNNLAGGGDGSLIPPYPKSDKSVDFSFRNPNSFSSYGTLTTIQYPTGGTEDFIYEPNTMVTYVPVNTMDIEGTGGPGGGTPSSPSWITYTNNSINVPFDQTVSFTLKGTQNGTYTVDSAYTTTFTLYEGSAPLTSHAVSGLRSYTGQVFLQQGHIYTMTVTVKTVSIIGTCVITYNMSPVPVYDTVNSVIPGVRLKQLKYTDPITSSTHSKYYTYASLAKLSLSTGSLNYLLGFESALNLHIYCTDAPGAEEGVNLAVYSSSATNQAYGYAGSGSNIYYTTVIESDDPNFINGGTEYTFYDNDDGQNLNPLLGNEIPYIPGGQYPTLSGVLSQTKIFNSAKQTVRIEQDVYGNLIDMSHAVTSYYVRQAWDPSIIANSAPNVLDRMGAFDVVAITYANYWIRRTAKIVTDYSSGNSFTQRTDYSYGTSDNILPSSTTTTDSKGNVWKTSTWYPNTYQPSDLASLDYADLNAKNQITPVVLQSSYLNSVLQNQKQIFYHDWFGDNKIVTPQKIQVMESPSDVLHDALIYNHYSTSGNPTELLKANDVTMAYLWDETLSLPIAEIKNATANQVAYTSFENGAKGNWSYSASVVSTSGFTGGSSFTGSLSYSAIAGNYIISLWATGSNVPTVNGSNCSLVRSNVINNTTWKLYQYNLSLASSSTVTVAISSGSLIDEVRLSPVGSMIQTFTYVPFVGVVAKGDENNYFTFFTYDGLNRLILIKDKDDNVIKKYDYHYLTNTDPTH